MDIETPYTFLMQIWSGIAADIIQLAIAALILPILFLRKIIAIPDSMSLAPFLNRWLYASWISLFLTIGIGVYYRTVNTCLIGKELVNKLGYSCMNYPGILFGIFSILFVIGIGCFAFGVLSSVKDAKNECK
ncbi:MAG TPA: hypothetical protein ENJ60_01255 [Aeromonadales bacterium]|nr:hypothetical protein [Aeromonadales bacterium]